MEGEAGRNVARRAGEGGSRAKRSPGSKDLAPKTPALRTADGKQARQRDTHDTRAVSPAPKDISAVATVPGEHPEATPATPSLQGGATASDVCAHPAASPQHSRQSKKSSGPSKSKSPTTTSSTTSNKQPKPAKAPKRTALPSSSGTPVRQPEAQDAAGVPPNTTQKAAKPETKHGQSGRKPKSKSTTPKACVIEAPATVGEVEKRGSRASQSKGSSSSVSPVPANPTSTHDGGQAENSPTSATGITTVSSTKISYRSTSEGTLGVAPKSRDSQVHVGTSGDHNRPGVTSLTTGNEDAPVAAAPACPDDRDPNIKKATMAEKSAAPVANATDERKGVRKVVQRRATKRENTDECELSTPGASFVTHRQESGRVSHVRSTYVWSFCPLDISFKSDVNSRDQRILYASAVLASAAMLAVTAVVLALIFYARRARSPLACVTSECVAARDYLNRLVNTSRDACSDFYGYVCDSWLERREDGGSFHQDNVAAWLAKVNESLLRDVGSEGDDAAEQGGIRIMRHVYGNCHHYLSNNSTTLSFDAMLESARKQLKWNEVRHAQSYKELVSHLARVAILSGFQTIITLETLRNHNRLAFRISRGRSLLRKLTATGNRKDLEEALRQVLKDDLPKIVEIDLVVDADLAGGRSAEAQDELDIVRSLSEILDGIFPEVMVADWVQVLNDALRSVNRSVHSDDTAFATGPQSFRNALRSLAEANGVARMARYMASHLDAEVLHLELSRGWMSSDPTRTARFCLALVQGCLTGSWPQLIAKLLDASESVNALKAINNELRQASHDSGALFTWLSPAMRKAAGEKTDMLTLVVVSENMRANSLAVDANDEDYALLMAYIKAHGVEFVELYLKVMAYGHQRRARSPPTLAQAHAARLERRHELAYLPTLQSVVVPTVYQMAPYLYATGVPSHYNYASVGALLSARIAEVVVPRALASRRGGITLHLAEPGPRHQKEASKYNASVVCLQRLHSRLGLQDHAVRSGELRRHAMYLQAVSLRLAYEGLLKSFGPDALTEEFRLMWPEAQKTFFVRFCLLSCDVDQEPDPLSPQASCLLPVHNMPEFAAAFGCASREDFVFDDCPL
ncbi:endothelin-converting enzyme homolog [Dermacentor albipictus]|uniref:endothelin-converting enzyme homolog n=1 Tax=Dermacentor albipictus TaxID=60249 RepID=UPI0031FE3FF1